MIQDVNGAKENNLFSNNTGKINDVVNGVIKTEEDRAATENEPFLTKKASKEKQQCIY